MAGILTSLFVFINAEKIVKSLGNEDAYYALIALVPALFLYLLWQPLEDIFKEGKL